jgi:hypothetical protein
VRENGLKNFHQKILPILAQSVLRRFFKKPKLAHSLPKVSVVGRVEEINKFCLLFFLKFS